MKEKINELGTEIEEESESLDGLGQQLNLVAKKKREREREKVKKRRGVRRPCFGPTRAFFFTVLCARLAFE